MKLYTFLFLLIGVLSYSQSNIANTQKWSFELNYPALLSEGDSNANEYGLISSSIKYRFINNKKFNLGLDGTFDHKQLALSKSLTPNEKTADFFYNLNLFLELSKTETRFQPYIGMGVTMASFEIIEINYSSLTSQPTSTQKIRSEKIGLNLFGGINYNVCKRFFINGSFKLVRVPYEIGFSNDQFWMNKHFINIGGGIRF